MRKLNGYIFFLSVVLAGILIVSSLTGCTKHNQSSPIEQKNEVPTLPVNEMLNIDERMIIQLRELREREKFLELPGTDTYEERKRLTKVLDSLLDRLITGISNNPNKSWVMEQFRISLEAVQMEDTEAREHFGDYLEQIMDIMQIQSSDGLLNRYLTSLN